MVSNKNFKNNTLKNFFRLVHEGKNVIIFGASDNAIIKIMRFFSDLEIQYFVDNDISKQGERLSIYNNNYNVYAPSILLDESIDDTVILIVSIYGDEIKAQLENMGFIDNYFWYNRFERNCESHIGFMGNRLIKQNRASITDVSNMLIDKKSKDVYESIIFKLEHGVESYSDIAEVEHDCYFKHESYHKSGQYFDNAIINSTPNEVYVDAGAYDGKTVFNFLTFCNYKYKKVYAFEADRVNCDKCEEALAHVENIEVIGKALWDDNVTLKFDPNGEGSTSARISKDGAEEVQAVKLDDYLSEPPTFIKMDIEGAELEALRGAQNIIKIYKPKLAICLYHKINDYWEIPKYIKSLVPEYNFYIRHYSDVFEETVLYAIINNDICSDC